MSLGGRVVGSLRRRRRRRRRGRLSPLSGHVRRRDARRRRHGTRPLIERERRVRVDVALLVCTQLSNDVRSQTISQQIMPKYERNEHALFYHTHGLETFRRVLFCQRTCIYVSKHTAAVLTAKDRIAAATYRITLAHSGYFLYFSTGRDMAPTKTAASPGDAGPHIIHSSLGQPKSTS